MKPPACPQPEAFDAFLRGLLSQYQEHLPTKNHTKNQTCWKNSYVCSLRPMLQDMHGARPQVPTWKDLQDDVGSPILAWSESNIPLTARKRTQTTWTQDFGFCCFSFSEECILSQSKEKNKCRNCSKANVAVACKRLLWFAQSVPWAIAAPSCSNHKLIPPKSNRSVRLNKSESRVRPFAYW